MGLLSDFCSQVKDRRGQMGLTQVKLAELSGLSRATIAAIEGGRIQELGLVRTEALLRILGLKLSIGNVHATRREMDAAWASCLTIANRGQRTNLDNDKLKMALTVGVQLLDWGKHLKAILEEADAGLLSALVKELQDADGVEPTLTWTRLKRLALQLGARGSLWDV